MTSVELAQKLNAPSLPRRLLLTSVCRPIGPKFGDGISVGYELLHGQVTRLQGIFSPRIFQNHFSLEYIAHNLDIPTAVLQYPSMRELIRELKRGYAYVGVSFIIPLFHRMKWVVSLIRQYSPESKIILGGYGTVLDDEILRPYGDYICREEGVGFIRRLLGEPEKSMPYHHPLIINCLKVYSLPLSPHGMIFAGLGCPNGCDFCLTSHFFRRRHIRLLPTGKDILDVIKAYQSHGVRKCTVIDEDFLLNKQRAMEFLQAVREENITPNLFVFASVKALSQYKVEELLEMGIDGVWMGYEGRRSGFAKQTGRNIDDLIKELQRHGINVLTSMIIGFDYQTPEVVQEELDDLIRLKPALAQFLIYTAIPGTPLYERIMGEKRLDRKFVEDQNAFYRRLTGFYGLVKHPNMSSEELERLQESCFRQDFVRLGPSIVRVLENAMLGYRQLKNSTQAFLHRRAEQYRQNLLEGRPGLFPARLLGPSPEARRLARELYREICREFGTPSLVDHIKSWVALVMALWTAVTLQLDLFQHPKLTRTTYRM